MHGWRHCIRWPDREARQRLPRASAGTNGSGTGWAEDREGQMRGFFPQDDPAKVAKVAAVAKGKAGVSRQDGWASLPAGARTDAPLAPVPEGGPCLVGQMFAAPGPLPMVVGPDLQPVGHGRSLGRGVRQLKAGRRHLCGPQRMPTGTRLRATRPKPGRHWPGPVGSDRTGVRAGGPWHRSSPGPARPGTPRPGQATRCRSRKTTPNRGCGP